jgi:hypothetical protein
VEEDGVVEGRGRCVDGGTVSIGVIRPVSFFVIGPGGKRNGDGVEFSAMISDGVTANTATTAASVMDNIGDVTTGLLNENVHACGDLTEHAFGDPSVVTSWGNTSGEFGEDVETVSVDEG